MQFAVFGEIALQVDDELLDVGGPKQRTLLAYLLARPNEPASTGVLVDVLWDGEAEPGNPDRVVQTYVSRLRRVAGSDRITSGRNGYALVVNEGELDVDRYVDRIEQARRLHHAGDPDRAASSYLRADDLWIGDPWADLGQRFWAVARVEQLRTLRASAAQEHATCLLEAGDPAAALERIRPVIRDHPLWDGLRMVEMLALHRLGRSVEASRAYQLHRQTMIEETGLEPSPDLAQLETRILGSDPALTRSGPTVRGYELVERIDETDLGVVWRAHQPSLDREVRLTIIKPELSDDPEFIRHFEAQVRRFSRIDHPSLGSILDAWRDFRGAFIVSPLPMTVDEAGPDGGWSMVRVRSLLADVASALAEVHDRGMSVGEIRQSDIAFDESGTAVLLGFDANHGRRWTSDADLRSLATLGLELIEESGDTDTGLQLLLEDVRSGESDGLDASGLAKRLRPAGPGQPVDHVRAGQGPSIGRKRDIRNPYKGLLPFDLADAGDFFGRKDVVAELVDRLLNGRFVTLVGPSGGGKSSVIRAGVLPALMTRAELGGQPWFGVTMTPGSDPFEALEGALLRIAVNPPATLLEQLTAYPGGLRRAVDRTLPDDQSDLLLLIDQFEELWTVTPAKKRELFVAALAESLHNPQSRLKVIATLRADFYDRPLAEPELGSVLAESSVPLPTLTAAELEEVVLGPARQVGLEIEPAVVAEFVRAGTSDTASLPLIQFALTQLVEQRETDVIGSSDLSRLGGIDGSIARRAEETYQQLDAEAQDAVRLVFGRLVTLRSGGATRRQAAQSELAGLAAERVVEAFAHNRLLAFDRDQDTREPTVEVAHEALLTAWPRLAEWTTEDGDELRIVGRLVASSARWLESNEDEGELLRGAPLAAAVALSEQHPQRLSELERRYVAAGADRLEEEQNRERRRSRRLRQSLVAVAAILAVALIAGSVAVVQRNTARQAVFAAESFRLLHPADNLADSDPSVALLLAAEAYRRSPSPETLGVIQRVMLDTGPFLGHRLNGVDTKAVHWLDEDRLVAISEGSVILFSARSGEILDQAPFSYPDDDSLIADGYFQPPVAVHRDSGQIAVTASAGTVEVFEVVDDTLTAVEPIQVGPSVRSLSFDPEGAMIYAGDANGSVHELDLGSSAVTGRWQVFDGPDWVIPDGYSTGEVAASTALFMNQKGVAGLHVDVQRVAAVGGSRITIWDRDSRSLTVSDYAVDPITAGSDGEPVLLFPRWVGGTSTDPDRLLVMGSNGVVGKINAATGRQTWSVTEGLRRQATYASPLDTAFVDGLSVTVADDAAIRTVDPDGGSLLGEVLPVLTGRPAGLAASPDGRRVAVATDTGVSVIALDGSGLLNDAFPFDVRPDYLTIAAGGTVAATGSFSPDAVKVFDRAAYGFEERTLDSDQLPGALLLYNPETLDPAVGVEFRITEDGLVSNRLIDPDNLEPLSDWMDDAGSRAVDPDNDVQYVRHEVENFDRPNGEHLFRVRAWPDGEEVAPPIEVVTGEIGAYPRVVLGAGRLVLGPHPFSGSVWAFDTEARALVDPPFSVDGGVHTIRHGLKRDRLYLTRVDGGIEERDSTTYEILRRMGGPESPTAFVDMDPLIVDEERDLWMTLFGAHPRLLDPSTGSQIGVTFPHDDREILPGSADGVQGAPLQLVTMVEGVARVWNLATETWYDLACAAAGRNLTAEEWELLGPRDAAYAVTCAQWPGGES